MDRALIVAEIRRCAEANGGVPLGRARFAAVTGITEGMWLGKHWARWNDALAEAGFEPNRMNTGFTDEHLLDQLALLVRKLGRFPTEPDLRLRRRQDRDVPSWNAFDRFGPKRDRIVRLHAYCSTRDDLADVAAICEAALAKPHTPRNAAEPGPGVQTIGFVYLLKSGGYFKIGRSNSVGRRSYEVALQLPERVTEVHHFATDDPAGIERYWHERFAAKRVNGEWFKLEARDVAAFKARREFM